MVSLARQESRTIGEALELICEHPDEEMLKLALEDLEKQHLPDAEKRRWRNRLQRLLED